VFGVWLACRASGRVKARVWCFAVVSSRLASPYNPPMVMTGHLHTLDRIGWWPVIWWGVTARRDGGMQPTPLRNDKIGTILAARGNKNAFPVYQCGAADGQAVRQPGHSAVGNEK
jgi:hypothetical protein